MTSKLYTLYIATTRSEGKQKKIYNQIGLSKKRDDKRGHR